MLFVSVPVKSMGKVEIIYINDRQQVFLKSLDLIKDMTVQDVLDKSMVHKIFPETKEMPVGVFSKKVALKHPVTAGDRVEIYRPLTADPKQRRKERALKSK